MMKFSDYDYFETFEVESPVVLETSYGIVDKSDKETLSITVGLCVSKGVGFFELYDVKTSGERFYAEGGLWVSGYDITDYDGVFELSNHIIKKLNDWGFDTSEIE